MADIGRTSDLGGSPMDPCRRLPSTHEFSPYVAGTLTTGDPDLLRRKVSQAEIDLHLETLAALNWHPVFCLLLIIDAGEEANFRCHITLNSLRLQSYLEWQVVILPYRQLDTDTMAERLANGLDDVRTLRDRLLNRFNDGKAWHDSLLDGLDDLRDRVEVVVGNGSRRISEVAEAACAAPLPSFLGVLRAGDELSADALLELAVTSGMCRDCDFFYSDEQRISPATESMEAFCKPQWSPDLLLSTNYIGRFWCANLQLIDRTGTTLNDLRRLGEYDFVLQCTEQAAKIRHIPFVLCQRGTGRLDSKATEERALVRALTRRGIEAQIQPGCRPGIYRVKRRVASPGRVSIIVPTRAAKGLIKTCIETLRALTDYSNFEVVCIDDIPEPEREWKRWLRANADKVVEVGEPFNWSRFNNRGATAAEGEFLLFLNDDVEIIEPGWLRAMIEHAQRPEVGVVGPQLLYPDATVQHAGMFLADLGVGRHVFRHQRRDEPGYFGLALTQRNVTAVTGACLLTRREIFEEVGGFEEAHQVINNDLDYCLKIRSRGLLCVFTPYAVLVHHERASRSPTDERYNSTMFATQWRRVFEEGDPYHHPRFSKQVDSMVLDGEAVEVLCVGHPLFDPHRVHKILLAKLDHIGDCVGAIPAIRRLKHHFPHASMTVLSGGWSKPIWSLVPEIDEVIILDLFGSSSDLPPREIPQAELRALRRRLEAYRFDLAIDLRRHPETRYILQYTGARYLAGFEHQACFPWLDIALDWEGDQRLVLKRRHFGDDFVSLVDAVAAAGERDRIVIPRNPGIPPNLPDDWLRAVFSRRVVCVHPGVGSEMRQWPVEYFAGLIDLLVERADVNVVMIGGSDDATVAATVFDHLKYRERVWSLVGKLDLRDLPPFLMACSLFVGNNSGPKHIAAGLGVPTVGIHSGNVDAREWGPMGPHALAVRRSVECSPCYLTKVKDCHRNLACLRELRPAEVYPVCQRLLALGWGGAWWLEAVASDGDVPLAPHLPDPDRSTRYFSRP
jgi:ADP-heptose:LPS heptosyltransferase/GT2 family glycosyltransferase